MIMRCEKVFEKTYRKEPYGTSFCPYRVCPIGAHSDHNLGKITGLAIDKGIHISYGPKANGVIELCSLQFEKRAQWHILSVPKTRRMDWADYLRGVTVELGRRHTLTTGLSGIIDGSLPIGGLSSSAAVSIAFLKALCDVNGIVLNPQEMIDIARKSENNYVGVDCGVLDQSCEVYGRKNHLLYLDCLDGSYELIPESRSMSPYDIVIFFSGLERNLPGTAFNMRVDEARSAAYALKAYAGIPYGKFCETNLRDVGEDVFRRYADRLPENWRKRGEHWYSEFNRVEAGVEAWRKGDMAGFGRLIFESGESSIRNWATGSEELRALYAIMKDVDGIYGGRFSGAGFNGSCIAIVNPDFTDNVISEVGDRYLKVFPDLRGRYKAFVCHSSDGTSL